MNDAASIRESSIEARRERRKQRTAEVFTPPRLVAQMLAKLPEEVWEEGKTFCDPACGDGNMLVAVLIRKIDQGHDPLKALQSIYGVDIMVDNVEMCRRRLLKVIDLNEIEITEDFIKTIFNNIKRVNPKKYPGGSLSYDFAFRKSEYNADDIVRWMDWVHKLNGLDDIRLPVRDEQAGEQDEYPFEEYEEEEYET